MQKLVKLGGILVLLGVTTAGLLAEQKDSPKVSYTLYPIGWVRKTDQKTFLEVDKKYQPGLLGVDQLSEIWVFYWFDRNDTPEKRAILQVHPQGNPANPLRGVFATRAPVRPNLIALSRCKIRSVKENIIEIDQIDAFADTPILDLKP